MRAGKKASVFGMQILGAESGQKWEWEDMQGAKGSRTLRNYWEVGISESDGLVWVLKRSLCEKYFGRKPLNVVISN